MTAVEEIRVLGAADQPRVVEWLLGHLESSVILLSNLERAGIVYEGKRYQATYVGRFDTSGALTALAAHSWNGWLTLQGDAGIEQTAALALESSGRPLGGLIGPGQLVSRVQQASGRAAVHESREILFSVELSALQVPALLERDDVEVGPPSADLLELLTSWRVEYVVEALSATRSPQVEERARENVVAGRDEGTLWILKVGGEVVSMTSTTAAGAGAVQIGGVYTPPSLRGRGYARCVVAGCLLAQRARGARLSTLFTGVENPDAQRVYRSLGYREIGDYGLVVF